MDSDLLSEESYKKYYAEKGFLQVWFRSYISAHNIILHCVFFIISLISICLINIHFPFDFRNYIGMISDIILTYSSAIIGFLLVSFSILLSISNVRDSFRYFVDADTYYKRPLLKVILDHFIFPIGIFLILLIMSLIIKILNGINIFNDIEAIYKILIFKALIFIYIFIILLSISELISYFFNIYRFIVMTSYTISKEYEEELLHKIYVKKEKIDVLKLMMQKR